MPHFLPPDISLLLFYLLIVMPLLNRLYCFLHALLSTVTLSCIPYLRGVSTIVVSLFSLLSGRRVLVEYRRVTGSHTSDRHVPFTLRPTCKCRSPPSRLRPRRPSMPSDSVTRPPSRHDCRPTLCPSPSAPLPSSPLASAPAPPRFPSLVTSFSLPSFFSFFLIFLSFFIFFFFFFFSAHVHLQPPLSLLFPLCPLAAPLFCSSSAPVLLLRSRLSDHSPCLCTDGAGGAGTSGHRPALG